MNKLLLKPQIYINEDGTYYLEGNLQEVEIFVSKNVHCNLLLEGIGDTLNIKIHVFENAFVFYQSFFKDVFLHLQVFLEGYGATIQSVCSMIASRTCGLKSQIFHLATHTESHLYHSIVNFGSNLASIQVDGTVPKNVLGCHLTQDNTIILIHDGQGKILPNLWIDEFDCFAEHAAYVSKFREEALFYLLSRGIKKQDAYFLLTKSLLLGKMKLNDEFLRKFTEMIQDMGR